MTPPPAWLQETANRVAQEVHSPDCLAPIGCHYYHDADRDLWEVTIFVSRTETVGGELDGKLTSSRFSVDLMGLESLFSHLDSFSWQAASWGEGDDLGPHLAIEGRIGPHNIWLRIAAEAPDLFEAGRVADVYSQRFDDRW